MYNHPSSRPYLISAVLTAICHGTSLVSGMCHRINFIRILEDSLRMRALTLRCILPWISDKQLNRYLSPSALRINRYVCFVLQPTQQVCWHHSVEKQHLSPVTVMRNNSEASSRATVVWPHRSIASDDWELRLDFNDMIIRTSVTWCAESVVRVNNRKDNS